MGNQVVYPRGPIENTTTHTSIGGLEARDMEFSSWRNTLLVLLFIVGLHLHGRLAMEIAVIFEIFDLIY